MYSAAFHPSGDYVIAGTEHHMVSHLDLPNQVSLLQRGFTVSAAATGSHLRRRVAAVLHAICLG